MIESGDYTIEILNQAWLKFIQKIVEETFIEGLVENWVTFKDFDGVGPFEAKQLEELYKVFKTSVVYHTMEYRSYWFFVDPDVKVIFGDYDKQTRGEFKIKVMDNKTQNIMWNHVNRNQVEIKYEGIIDDLTPEDFAAKDPE